MRYRIQITVKEKIYTGHVLQDNEAYGFLRFGVSCNINKKMSSHHERINASLALRFFAFLLGMNLRTLNKFFRVFALAALIPVKAYAVPIATYTETESGGIHQYDFTLGADPGDFVFELFLDIPVDSADILDVYAPVGWGSISDPFAPGFLAWGDNGFGGTFIDSTADFGAELFGSGELNGFGFTSTSQATGSILFSVNFDPGLSDATLVTSVPEPATLPLFSVGILMALFAGKSRKTTRTG